MFKAAIASLGLGILTALAFAPMPAYAGLTSPDCDLAEMDGELVFTSVWEIESYLNHPTFGPPPTSTQVDESIKKIKSDISGFNKSAPGCKDPKVINLARAKISDGKMILARFQGGDWQPLMNLAIQQYTRCESDYFAEKQGADCQTRAEELIGYKVKWQQPDPEPSPE